MKNKLMVALALTSGLLLSGCFAGTLIGTGAYFYCKGTTTATKMVARNVLTGGTQVVYCEEEVQVDSSEPVNIEKSNL